MSEQEIQRYVVRGNSEDGAGPFFMGEVVLAWQHDDAMYALHEENERVRAANLYMQDWVGAARYDIEKLEAENSRMRLALESVLNGVNHRGWQVGIGVMADIRGLLGAKQND